MNTSRWFSFYTADFLTGTADLSPAEVGCYIRLLSQAWERDGLDPDARRLAVLAGVKVTPAVLAKFTLGEDGRLRNDRQEAERHQQRCYRAQQSALAQRRWNKPALALPDARPGDALAYAKASAKGHAKAHAKAHATADAMAHAKADATAVPRHLPTDMPRHLPMPCSSSESEHPELDQKESPPAAPSIRSLTTPEVAESAPPAEPEAAAAMAGLSLRPAMESSAMTRALAQAWVLYRSQCLAIPRTAPLEATKAGTELARWCGDNGVTPGDVAAVMDWLAGNHGPDGWRMPPATTAKFGEQYPMIRQRMGRPAGNESAPVVNAEAERQFVERRRRERAEYPAIALAEEAAAR